MLAPLLAALLGWLAGAAGNLLVEMLPPRAPDALPNRPCENAVMRVLIVDVDRLY